MTVENQTISIVIDGEAAYNEGLHFVSSVANHPEIGQTASRYQLIGACMRGDTTVDTSELFNRIHDQLQDEPTVLAPAATRAKRPVVTKTAAGFAVAATVAAAVVFSVLRVQAPVETLQVADNTPELQSFATLPSLVANRSAVDSASETARLINTGNPDLDRYLLQHQDYIGSGAFGPGFATATMVSYDNN